MLGRVRGECYSFELGLVHDARGEALWPPGGGLAKRWGQDKDRGACAVSLENICRLVLYLLVPFCVKLMGQHCFLYCVYADNERACGVVTEVVCIRLRDPRAAVEANVPDSLLAVRYSWRGVTRQRQAGIRGIWFSLLGRCSIAFNY